jgi:hypothetical protein
LRHLKDDVGDTCGNVKEVRNQVEDHNNFASEAQVATATKLVKGAHLHHDGRVWDY